jgi:hypothetical protein
MASLAPAIIACGLIILALAAWWPAAPVVTAFALVAMGATCVTAQRYRGKPALAPTMCVHLAIYGALYALFVGAAIHGAARGTAGSTLPTSIDLAASLGPIVGVLCIVRDALRETRFAK